MRWLPHSVLIMKTRVKKCCSAVQYLCTSLPRQRQGDSCQFGSFLAVHVTFQSNIFNIFLCSSTFKAVILIVTASQCRSVLHPLRSWMALRGNILLRHLQNMVISKMYQLRNYSLLSAGVKSVQDLICFLNEQQWTMVSQCISQSDAPGISRSDA